MHLAVRFSLPPVRFALGVYAAPQGCVSLDARMEHKNLGEGLFCTVYNTSPNVMFVSVGLSSSQPTMPHCTACGRYPTNVNSLRTTCGSALPTPSRRGFVRAMSSQTRSHPLAAAQRNHRRFGAVVPQGAEHFVESRGASCLHAIVAINNA